MPIYDASPNRVSLYPGHILDDESFRLIKAAEAYHRRNSKDKMERWFPDGHWAGPPISSTWYPNPAEVADCCKGLAMPTWDTKWRFMLLKHCCTFEHIANLWRVERRVLMDAVYHRIYLKDDFRRTVLAKAMLAKPRPERRKRASRVTKRRSVLPN